MITRFAPSPTGALHLGHALSALTVWDIAKQLGGTALLRIEDTDSTRVRPAHEAAIYDDLHWLGIDWPTPVLRQSEHTERYTNALSPLNEKGLIYPCSCTRKDIQKAGALPGADGAVYPGTCRHKTMADRQDGDALRLNLAKAAKYLPESFKFTETGMDAGEKVFRLTEVQTTVGDPVLVRKVTGDPAYHFTCVLDDAYQGATHVVRGTDLQALTPLHVLLQALFGLPTPIYHHHRLITDANGKRLAKIDHSTALAHYRQNGVTPSEIMEMIGFTPS